MAMSAAEYIYSLGLAQLTMWQESFASSSLAGNEMADVLGETLRRLLAHEPCSDRYVLGLAWYLKEFSNLGRFTKGATWARL